MKFVLITILLVCLLPFLLILDTLAELTTGISKLMYKASDELLKWRDND